MCRTRGERFRHLLSEKPLGWVSGREIKEMAAASGLRVMYAGALARAAGYSISGLEGIDDDPPRLAPPPIARTRCQCCQRDSVQYRVGSPLPSKCDQCRMRCHPLRRACDLTGALR